MILIKQILRVTNRPKKLTTLVSSGAAIAAIPAHRAVFITKFGLFGLLGLLGLSSQALALNKIQTENLLPGSAAWYNFNVLGWNAADNVHDMEGFASKDSVNIGQQIKLYVNANKTKDPQYSINIYRLGWYQGYGARLMTTTPIVRSSTTQTIPVPDSLGTVKATNWANPYTLTIPASWTAGIYVATIIGNTTAKGQYIPFVVTDTARSSDYLFQVSTTTWQAYNAWGGKSLYGFNSTGGAARKVSFDRPYQYDGGLGGLRTGDLNMLNFLEREGFDVTYQSDIDTHAIANGNLLKYKSVLSVGHDEYWTKAMRDNFENARDHGISLGFFGANIAYWQIRMENANRTIVGYKDFSATEDPLRITNKALVTSRWRNPTYANRPENALIGVMYAFGPLGTSVLDTDLKASKNDPWQTDINSHWTYTATGVLETDLVTGVFKGLLGYEADRIFDNGYTPIGLEAITASPVPTGVVDHDSPLSVNYDPLMPKSHATVYTKPCTLLPCNNAVSTVFAAGSLQWNWGLDTAFLPSGRREDWSIIAATCNVLSRMVSVELPPYAPVGVDGKFKCASTSPVISGIQAVAARISLPNSLKNDNPSLRLLTAERERENQKGGRDSEAKMQDKEEAKREREVKGDGEIVQIKGAKRKGD
jgi:hypothetical protein